MNFGRPIPTWKELAPSGFPNFTQFYFFYGSVKHSYDLEIMINLAAASGLLGFLSGWYKRASFLNILASTCMIFWFCSLEHQFKLTIFSKGRSQWAEFQDYWYYKVIQQLLLYLLIRSIFLCKNWHFWFIYFSFFHTIISVWWTNLIPSAF
jgi:hypothetical protein